MIMFLSGAIYTATEGYDAGFYFAGSIVFVSGIVLSTLPCIKQEETKRTGRRDTLAWQIGLPRMIERRNSVSVVTKL